MKSWADHCSSDEESFNEDTPLEELEDAYDDLGPKADVGLPEHNEHHLNDLDDEDDVELDNNDPEEEELPPVKQQTRTYDYPSRPPYNIFVGNLAYSVKDPKKLTEAMTQLIEDRIGGNSIVIKDARVAYESRNNKNHRGFGYIQVETLDDMKLILDLNAQDPPAMLAGRKVQFDTANQNSDNSKRNNNNNRRVQSMPDIDGRQFRGGRYNSNSQNNNDNSNRKGGRRDSTGSSTGGQQRPSLKLQPRTKPVEDVTGSTNNDKANADNIFGGGRARDVGSNSSNRSSNNRSNNNRGSGRNNNGSNNNNSGRGGRGGNNRQGSDRRNRRSNNNNNSEDKKPQVLPPKTTTQQESKPAATKKTVNSFAALLLDDSDSD